jgi:transcriptional regulator NrdR family protein
MAAPATQVRRGRRQYCPRCKEPQITHAARPYKFGESEHRCVKSEKFDDIQWFRRVRICSVCGPHFITAELDEKLVTELIKSRDRLVTYARERVEVVKSSRAWLKTRTETIPRELAVRLVRASAWWHTHSSG